MSMLNFEFQPSTRYVFGKETHLRTGEIASSFGAKKVLLHYGGGNAIKSGLIDTIKQGLSKENIEWVELGGVQPNPRDSLVYEGITLVRENDIDFILAVGGGSVIDSSKAIALGARYEGDFWDFFAHDAEPQDAVPVGVVLTISAAGSEGSPGTVITKEEGLLKRSVSSELIRPKFSIMNPVLTFSLPAYQTAAGGVDIMAHVLERYCTRTQGVDVTDRMCEAILSTMFHQLPIALQHPDDYDARANIMWAGTLAHNGIAGVGRAEDWGTHSMEHELSALYDVTHGAGLAVLFPAWMRYQYHHDVMRFAQLAVRVMGCDMDYRDPARTAEDGIDRLEYFFRAIGMPTSFDEIGAKEEDIPLMASKCYLNNGERLGLFHPLSRKDIEAVYRLAVK